MSGSLMDAAPVSGTCHRKKKEMAATKSAPIGMNEPIEDALNDAAGVPHFESQSICSEGSAPRIAPQRYGS